ncbi:small ribosomal subunit protein mS31 [Hyperolius riggenbachi]|uniref:small ribosomal subunit protein mS31 n=1 Tax=Hyperolius riggenbachi TaxID=752182 RepID=UPI0035A36F7D
MYRSRVVLCLGGRAVTAGNAASRRCCDPLIRWFSVGSAYCSEKTPPENNGAAAPPAEEKADAAHQDDNSQPPKPGHLMDILSSMKVNVSSKKKLLAMKSKSTKDKRLKTVGSVSQMFQMAGEDPKEEESVGPELEAAATAVAETFPEKKAQVESELLRQLRLHKQKAEAQRKGLLDVREKSASPELEPAASSVAETFPEKKAQIQSELLQQLRLHKQKAEAQRKGPMDLSDVISGMKVENRSQRSSWEAELKVMRNQVTVKRSQGVFSSKRLEKFPIPSVSEETTMTEYSPTLWDLELAKELAEASEHPPRNALEEVLKWTKEGKLWAFPIDNEAGMEEEQNVEFHEHVFLEKYLEDFPVTGPIRHFMELVVCGLSKNPFITVQQKKEHIDWFRNYFNQKEEILKECDVYVN